MGTPDPGLSELRHRDLRWNTPLSAAHADRLIDFLDLGEGDRLVDLGCGWGALLLRALTRRPGTTGEGLDTDEGQLARARSLADSMGLADRATFTRADVTKFSRQAERAICIGAAHAWGSTGPALTALRSHLAPRGRLLFGEGFWTRPPSPQLRQIFGALPTSLAALVDEALKAGLRPVHADVASEAEWDEFEWTALRALEEFAARNPADPRAGAAREEAERRRREYLHGYRGVLGFGYLVLANP